MEKIITVNPSVDKSTTLNGIKPTSKLRCSESEFEAGGINVSRVIDGIGKASQCLFMAVLMVTQNEIEKLSAPTVHQHSTMGAGDSMVAGLVYGLSNQKIAQGYVKVRDSLRNCGHYQS